MSPKTEIFLKEHFIRKNTVTAQGYYDSCLGTSEDPSKEFGLPKVDCLTVEILHYSSKALLEHVIMPPIFRHHQ